MTLFSNAATAATTAHIPAPVIPQAMVDEQAIIAASHLTEADPIDLPGLAQAMRPWQDAALQYCFDSFERWGCVLEGDDMGLGKTRVALALIKLNRWQGQGPAIVVTPPANLGTYQRELEAAFPDMKMYMAKGRTPCRIPADTDIVWMSDDALTMRAWLSAGERVVRINGKDHKTLIPSALLSSACLYVRDEIHRDKGAQAKPTLRAKVSLLAGNTMRENGRYVVGMTGTMLQNRPVEAFLPLQIIGGEALVKAMVPGANTMGSFLVRYCAGDTNGHGTTWNGASHTAELHERLRATVYVRREKSEIDPEALPHFGWQIVPLALGSGVLAKYERAEQDLLDLILEEKGPEAAFRASRAEAIVRMQRLWQEAGKAKAKATVEYTQQLIEDGDQAIVWYQHTDVFETLLAEFTKAGIRCGWINGATRDRRAMEDEFQAGGTQVMLAQLQAAGQAVTLTAARHSVWTQTPWSAGMLAQQKDRNRRCDDVSRDRAARGESIEYHVLQAAHENGKPTFDVAMWNVVEAKAKVCDAVNAGQDVTLPDESIMFEAMRTWFESR